MDHPGIMSRPTTGVRANAEEAEEAEAAWRAEQGLLRRTALVAALAREIGTAARCRPLHWLA